MQTKKLAIVLTLGTILMSGCTMFKKNPKANAEFADTGAISNQKPVVTPEQLAGYVKGWPDSSQAAAKLMIEKHGNPNQSTTTHLVWNMVQPYKRILVYREEVTHRFPILHLDVIEHVVNHRIPTEKAGELTRFDGSVTFNRTAGELSARSNSEAMNILALNLASDIINGKRDADNARVEYGKRTVDILNGNRSPLSENLQFIVQSFTADADESAKIRWAQAQEEKPKDRKQILRQAQEEEIAE